MKALIRNSYESEDFSIKEIEEPQPGAGEIKVKVKYAGICGTDLHMYEGAFTDLPVPAVPGHEFSGVVTEIGSGVENYKTGDRVTAEHTFSVCENCSHCKTGNYHLCEERTAIGFEEPGCFAEYVIVREDYVHKLPENITMKEGALTEPLACVLHGIEMINPQPGQRALVVGPGPIGLMAGICLKAYNCQVDIIGTAADKLRLEKAKELGINIVDSIEGKNYELVAECSGSEGGVNTALEAVAEKGQYLQVGINTDLARVDFDKLVFKEIRVQGTFCHHWPTWEKCLKLESMGIIDLRKLITVVNFEDWEKGIQQLINREAIKVLLKL